MGLAMREIHGRVVSNAQSKRVPQIQICGKARFRTLLQYFQQFRDLTPGIQRENRFTNHLQKSFSLPGRSEPKYFTFNMLGNLL